MADKAPPWIRGTSSQLSASGLLPSQPQVQQVKVPIKVKGFPPALILGNDGFIFKNIYKDTGATCTLVGPGSGNNESEPLHILIEHSNTQALQHAKRVAENLVNMVEKAYLELLNKKIADQQRNQVERQSEKNPHVDKVPATSEKEGTHESGFKMFKPVDQSDPGLSSSLHVEQRYDHNQPRPLVTTQTAQWWDTSDVECKHRHSRSADPLASSTSAHIHRSDYEKLAQIQKSQGLYSSSQTRSRTNSDPFIQSLLADRVQERETSNIERRIEHCRQDMGDRSFGPARTHRLESLPQNQLSGTSHLTGRCRPEYTLTAERYNQSLMENSRPEQGCEKLWSDGAEERCFLPGSTQSPSVFTSAHNLGEELVRRQELQIFETQAFNNNSYLLTDSYLERKELKIYHCSRTADVDYSMTTSVNTSHLPYEELVQRKAVVVGDSRALLDQASRITDRREVLKYHIVDEITEADDPISIITSANFRHELAQREDCQKFCPRNLFDMGDLQRQPDFKIAEHSSTITSARIDHHSSEDLEKRYGRQLLESQDWSDMRSLQRQNCSRSEEDSSTITSSQIASNNKTDSVQRHDKLREPNPARRNLQELKLSEIPPYQLRNLKERFERMSTKERKNKRWQIFLDDGTFFRVKPHQLVKILETSNADVEQNKDCQMFKSQDSLDIRDLQKQHHSDIKEYPSTITSTQVSHHSKEDLEERPKSPMLISQDLYDMRDLQRQNYCKSGENKAFSARIANHSDKELDEYRKHKHDKGSKSNPFRRDLQELKLSQIPPQKLRYLKKTYGRMSMEERRNKRWRIFLDDGAFFRVKPYQIMQLLEKTDLDRQDCLSRQDSQDLSNVKGQQKQHHFVLEDSPLKITSAQISHCSKEDLEEQNSHPVFELQDPLDIRDLPRQNDCKSEENSSLYAPIAYHSDEEFHEYPEQKQDRSSESNPARKTLEELKLSQIPSYQIRRLKDMYARMNETERKNKQWRIFFNDGSFFRVRPHKLEKLLQKNFADEKQHQDCRMFESKNSFHRRDQQNNQYTEYLSTNISPRISYHSNEHQRLNCQVSTSAKIAHHSDEDLKQQRKRPRTDEDLKERQKRPRTDVDLKERQKRPRTDEDLKRQKRPRTDEDLKERQKRPRTDEDLKERQKRPRTDEDLKQRQKRPRTDEDLKEQQKRLRTDEDLKRQIRPRTDEDLKERKRPKSKLQDLELSQIQPSELRRLMGKLNTEVLRKKTVTLSTAQERNKKWRINLNDGSFIRIRPIQFQKILQEHNLL